MNKDNIDTALLKGNEFSNGEKSPLEIIDKYATYSSGLGILPGTILSSASLSFVIYKMVLDLASHYKHTVSDKTRLAMVAILTAAVFHTIKAILDSIFDKVPQLKLLSSMVSGAVIAHLMITITGKIVNGMYVQKRTIDEISFDTVISELKLMAQSGDLKKDVLATFAQKSKLPFSLS